MNEGYKYKGSYKESLESLKLIKNLYLNYYVKKNEGFLEPYMATVGGMGPGYPTQR